MRLPDNISSPQNQPDPALGGVVPVTHLADQVDAVRMTIEDPVTITKSHKDIDREMYYRPFVLRPPHHNFYLKVIVEFPWSSGGASTEGSIITVYVDHEVDPREEVKYGLS